ncbi:HotDog domain-containing protein [Penicillium cosmopolitanum]|uniref:HotDog domain-containing protein n=1 Tax=Penicillium cosmopolitanum TaxID=1131564 RepID=A0A9W9W9S2_9EURO|nr:HotDog domain-containing protein [Penicillium cosmopolitanum]KAJ5408907.1 HotDog domain-containing protein [Penicillium cosmopolitanum]
MATIVPTKSNQRQTVYRVASSPTNDAINEIGHFIFHYPLTMALRRNPQYRESRPHLHAPASLRGEDLLDGALAGHQKITAPPYIFEKAGQSMTMIMHLGGDVCSYSGIVQGGLLPTIPDECLVRYCCPAFDKKVGVTANLSVDYRSPAKANSFYVLKADVTEFQGRKAWAKGCIETLPVAS